MPIPPDAFVSGLLNAIPETQTVVDEHYGDNGELLLHLLMADLARFAYAAFRARRTDVASRLLNYLDVALREGDHQVENAVCLSFVASVSSSKPGQQKFIATWPPALQEEAERQAG